ncbi:unnamed protein product [Adineta ricciae]|uniref:Nuclear receptor domain-containing protein n=1 Tax=Adineta ricciae TaxID=249248 RepID=A0A816H0R2_ADIRI|nr:unnamed protein product [Adineta ricciae]CAF1679870.1 unnamed protein product [Adineta ricciae]
MWQEQKQMSTSPFDCAVCGAGVYGNNSDIRMCLPCKSFFRRYTLLPANTLKCSRNGTCDIEVTRRYFSSSVPPCRACRFHKCLSVSMNESSVRPRSSSTPPFNMVDKVLLKTSLLDEKSVPSTKQIDNENLMFTRPRCSSDVSVWQHQTDLSKNRDYFMN